jgi:hypothetical protein
VLDGAARRFGPTAVQAAAAGISQRHNSDGPLTLARAQIGRKPRRLHAEACRAPPKRWDPDRGAGTGEPSAKPTFTGYGDRARGASLIH